MQNFEEYLSNGRWHRLDLSLRTNNLTVVVNGNSVVTVRLISIVSGVNTFVGGEVSYLYTENIRKWFLIFDFVVQVALVTATDSWVV